MDKYVRDIKEQYKFYTQVINGLKFPQHNLVYLISGKGSHRKYCAAQSNVTCIFNERGHLNIRQSKAQTSDYGFQLFIERFRDPILRFDADGASHYKSKDKSIPLLEREIRTPHFHKYDEKGIEIAYRTTTIDNETFNIQSSIQIGLNVFCEENYIKLRDDSKLIVSHQQEIFPDQVSNDVHKGIPFL